MRGSPAAGSRPARSPSPASRAQASSPRLSASIASRSHAARRSRRTSSGARRAPVSMSARRRAIDGYCATGRPVRAMSRRLRIPSALRATWLSTWRRDHPGSSEGAISSGIVHAVDRGQEALRRGSDRLEIVSRDHAPDASGRTRRSPHFARRSSGTTWAEAEGFEPSMGFKPQTALAVRRHRPG